MLRILSGFLLLIISQFSFASVSYTTIPAISSGQYSITVGNFTVVGSDKLSICQDAVAKSCAAGGYCVAVYGVDGDSCMRYGGVIAQFIGVTAFTCDSGYFLSDSQGNPSSSGQYCTTSVDSCESLSGQVVQLYTLRSNPQVSLCYGGCVASRDVVAVTDATVNLTYVYFDYTYTGETSECVEGSDTNTSEADALAANAASVEAARQAAVAQAVADAKAGCGSAGYTEGTFNGDTVIACKGEPTQTTVNNTAQSTTTTTNADGSTTTTTTTTTTNNTTINNNNSSTTVGSNGSSSTTSGTTGGSSSSTTKTEAVTTNPDGTTTTEITETTSGAGNTAGIFEAPGEGNDFLKDIFSAEAIEDLKQAQESTKEQISALQTSTKNLFAFGALAASGTMVADTRNIMGASVDLSGKSAIDLFTQAGIGSAFWVLAILIGITVVLTKRN